MDSSQQRDQLSEDMHAVIKDAEELLKISESQMTEGFKKARGRFEQTLNNAKNELARVEDAAIAKAKAAATATDSYVRENPWQSVGLGAAVGLVLGLLIGRK